MRLKNQLRYNYRKKHVIKNCVVPFKTLVFKNKRRICFYIYAFDRPESPEGFINHKARENNSANTGNTVSKHWIIQAQPIIDTKTSHSAVARVLAWCRNRHCVQCCRSTHTLNRAVNVVVNLCSINKASHIRGNASLSKHTLVEMGAQCCGLALAHIRVWIF